MDSCLICYKTNVYKKKFQDTQLPSPTYIMLFDKIQMHNLFLWKQILLV